MLLLLAAFVFSAPHKFFYSLNLTDGSLAPDCIYKNVILANGVFPAPEIRVSEDSFLHLTIFNNLLTDPITIHLHGIDQVGTPFYDGVPGISQDAILPGKSFTINTYIPLNTSGTYIYHAHYSLLFLSGPLIVDSVKPLPQSISYNDERTVMLSDWWHESPSDQLFGLLASRTFKWINNSKSILTNGKTIFNSSDLSLCDDNSTGYEVIPVDHGKTYRFRIIGAFSLHTIAFSIPNHVMTLIEIDGVFIDPVVLDYLEVGPGQRYSVLITMNSNITQHWMNSSVLWRPGGAKNGLSILRYDNHSPGDYEEPVFIQGPSEVVEWGQAGILFKEHPTLKKQVFPDLYDQIFILHNQQIKYDDGTIRWTINGIPFMPPNDDPLLIRGYTSNYSDLTSHTQILFVSPGQVIDVVLQNYPSASSVCESHPWHLHGHSFWDLGGGPGLWQNQTLANLAFPMRDVVTLYPHNGAYFQENLNSSVPCGWKRIRFVADNSGFWPFHCHIPAHMVMGMMVVFGEGIYDLPALPDPNNA